MEEVMGTIFGILATITGIYSLLIFVRIIISWFGRHISGKPVNLLSRVTDPYLNWWSRNLQIRAGFFDFSIIAAIAALSVLQSIFSALSRSGIITVGFLLAVVLSSAWSVVSFILGFCLVVIVLRLIAYLANSNIYSPFWRMVDSVSRPLLYRLNRIFFGNRIGNYLHGIILSVIVIGAVWAGGRFAFPILAGMLARLPF
jgi:YggT family protein